jgi:hypothetical protein
MLVQPNDHISLGEVLDPCRDELSRQLLAEDSCYCGDVAVSKDAVEIFPERFPKTAGASDPDPLEASVLREIADDEAALCARRPARRRSASARLP